MRIAVAYGPETVDLEVPEERLLGMRPPVAWAEPADIAADIPGTLEAPRDFPPLRSAIVPGDRIVVALGPGVDHAEAALAGIGKSLAGSGLAPESVTALVTARDADIPLPPGMNRAVHDPDAKADTAYLATTSTGRRIYLNKLLTDADFVLPVGPIRFDPTLGDSGPWNALYPAFSDADSQREFHSAAARRASHAASAAQEAGEVEWLLGSQFQLGIVAGSGQVIAGGAEAVKAAGSAAIEDLWHLRLDRRADLVLAGVGSPDRPTRWPDVADALATAVSIVAGGGRIALLTTLSDEVGPALGRLLDIEDAGERTAVLRGAEGEDDYPTARRLADALARADVFLLSGLEDDTVERLGMRPLGSPAEAGRLVNLASVVVVVSRAEMMRITVDDE